MPCHPPVSFARFCNGTSLEEKIIAHCRMRARREHRVPSGAESFCAAARRSPRRLGRRCPLCVCVPRARAVCSSHHVHSRHAWSIRRHVAAQMHPNFRYVTPPAAADALSSHTQILAHAPHQAPDKISLEVPPTNRCCSTLPGTGLSRWSPAAPQHLPRHSLHQSIPAAAATRHVHAATRRVSWPLPRPMRSRAC